MTTVDIAQLCKDVLDEVIVYLKGEITKLVAKMGKSGDHVDPETGYHPDDYFKAQCWHVTEHIMAIQKMKSAD